MTLFLISVGLIILSAFGLAAKMADMVTDWFEAETDWNDRLAKGQDSEDRS